jgi:predicted acetyltransferase
MVICISRKCMVYKLLQRKILDFTILVHRISLMSQIRKLSIKELADFIPIIINAYPGFGIDTEEKIKKTKQRLIKLQRNDPVINFYGLFRNKKLLGGMRLHDFTMNFFSTKIKVGGVGLIAVDLIHKKEKICKELVMYFLRHYRKRGACMTALYPFRPDFYQKMGFGYGTKMNRYKIKPVNLPRGDSKKHIKFLNKKDMQKIIDCYNRYYENTHGMMEKCMYELGWLSNPNTKSVGYKSNNKILGYIAFSFKPEKKDNFIANNMHIKEFIYENRKVLAELLTFLHTQADQIHYIIFNTQDEYFHYLPLDPRDPANNLIEPITHETNTQGLDIMYRVINTEILFKIQRDHNFGGQNCRLKLSIQDSFFPENKGSLVIHFVDGKPYLKNKGKHDVEIHLDISNFSSLVMGAVNFKNLYNYNLAEISDIKYIDTVNKIFMTDTKPKCTTQF